MLKMQKLKKKKRRKEEEKEGKGKEKKGKIYDGEYLQKHSGGKVSFYLFLFLLLD